MIVDLVVLQNLVEEGYGGKFNLVDFKFACKNPYTLFEESPRRLRYDSDVILINGNGDPVIVNLSSFCFKEEEKQEEDKKKNKKVSKPPLIYNSSTGKYELDPDNLEELIRKEVKDRLALLGRRLLDLVNM